MFHHTRQHVSTAIGSSGSELSSTPDNTWHLHVDVRLEYWYSAIEDPLCEAPDTAFLWFQRQLGTVVSEATLGGPTLRVCGVCCFLAGLLFLDGPFNVYNFMQMF